MIGSVYKFPQVKPSLFFYFSEDTPTHSRTSKDMHCEQMPSVRAARELLQTEIRENTSIYVPLPFIYSWARARGRRGAANPRPQPFSTPEPAALAAVFFNKRATDSCNNYTH